MDAAQWPQEIINGGGVVDYYSNVEKKRPRPQQETEALNCPRCNSTNTKFCYYNNYSLSQPRYLCKACRRYWTQGGTLRNVPVGGASRKNKRSSAKKVLIPADLTPPKHPNPNLMIHDDLNSSSYNYPLPPVFNSISELVALPFAVEAGNLNTQKPNYDSVVEGDPISKILFPFNDSNDPSNGSYWAGMLSGDSW